MSDPYLTIVSDGGSIRSDEIQTNGSGVEVKAGVTGFGLPSVDLQFDDSAGDGSRYRGRRVQQRALDLKFHVYGPNRESLKPHLDRVSQVLAHPCTLSLVDPDAGEEWRIVGYRSGGGDYAYGVADEDEGTDTYTYANLAVTLTTETPYWESAFSITKSIPGAGPTAITNPGTVTSPPIWSIKGPTNGFKATNEKGESLWFSGLVDSNTTVTIDCAKGTVVDSNGQNRYNDLTDLPRFFHLDEGTSTVTVGYDRSSDDYQEIYGTPRHNFVKNPRFQTGTNFWTLTGFSYDTTNRMILQNNNQDDRPVATTVLSGLTIGANYVVRIVANNTRMTGWPVGSTTFLPGLIITDGLVQKKKTYGNTELTGFGSVPFTFTAENTSVTLSYYPHSARRKDGKWARSEGYLDLVYVGEPGNYFDGSYADALNMQYDWTGDPDASVSTATPITIPTSTGGVSNPIVTVEYRPRKWLVI